MKELLPYLVPLFTGFIGWLVGYRKTNAEASVSELDAVEKAVGIWRELANSFRVDLEQMRKQYDVLETTVKNLKDENEVLKRQVRNLERNMSHK